MATDQLPQLGRFLAIQIVRGAAAPMHLRQSPPLGHGLGDQLQFLCQRGEIGLHHLGTELGGDPVAAAIPAGMATEGHMDVQRQGRVRDYRQLLSQLEVAHIGAKRSGGGVAGVTGHRPIVFEQQLEGSAGLGRCCHGDGWVAGWMNGAGGSGPWGCFGVISRAGPVPPASAGWRGRPAPPHPAVPPPRLRTVPFLRSRHGAPA